jgi:hyperosmotically inducible protein
LGLFGSTTNHAGRRCRAGVSGGSMKLRLTLSRSLLLGLALLAPVFVTADSSDTWITTKAKLALLTADDVSATSVNVDTVDGNVTLHGKVKTEAEKTRAETAVRGIEGVKNVKNLLQVVPEGAQEGIKVADDRIEEKLETSLKADAALRDVKVASVNDGVVLLSGKTDTLASKLKAVETAWRVDGVKRVSAEIETREK